MPLSAVLTVLVYSVLPFAGFLNDNKRQSIEVGALLPYLLLVLLPALFILLAVNFRKGREVAERAAVVMAAGLFVFLSFPSFFKVLQRLDLIDRELEIWAVVFAVAIGLSYLAAKHVLVRRYVLVAGLLLLALPLGQYVSFRLTASGGSEAVSRADIPPVAGSRLPGERPNVYFFVLDGYARSDQLLKHLDFDNGAFTSALSERGFRVATKSHSSYPHTHLSIASTLEMDYPVTDGGNPGDKALPGIIRGANETVRSFRALGYNYVLAPSGFWSVLLCSGIEDLCVKPLKGSGPVSLDELDWALLRLTPLASVVLRWVPALAGGTYNEPNHVLDTLAREKPREPYFVFSHMLNPHPPYRYRPDCSLRDIDPASTDLWIKPLYLDMLRCVNMLMGAAVDRILRQDPGAIIIIQGDHGTAFTVNPDQDVSAWSVGQVQERFSNLNAIRLPSRCRKSLNDSIAPVNTFRIVLACLRHEEPELLPFEAYVASARDGEVARVSEKWLSERDRR